MAAQKRGGLGKGLGALLGNNHRFSINNQENDDFNAGSEADEQSAEKNIPSKDKVQKIKVSALRANRFQPRTDFADDKIDELAASIKEYGILQPLLVRYIGENQYELIAGERRLRAAKSVGLDEVPVIALEFNDREIAEVALIENLQREDLSPLEAARGYRQLIDKFQMTQEELAFSLSISRSQIANTMRLLNLAPEVQSYLENGDLTVGQARPLLALPTEELQVTAADRIVAEDLSAREVEALVKKLVQSENKQDKEELTIQVKPSKSIYLLEAEEKLKKILGTQVKINAGKKKSSIAIEYYSDEDLERILTYFSKYGMYNTGADVEAPTTLTV